MGEEDEKVRRILGTLAGGVLGGSTAGKRHAEHPRWGALADAFVGGVAGLFTADGLNALIGSRKDTSTEYRKGGSSSGEDIPVVDQDRAIAIASLNAMALGVAAANAFWYAIIEVIPAEAFKGEIPDAECIRLMREKKDVFLALFERQCRTSYKRIVENALTVGKERYGVDLGNIGDPPDLDRVFHTMEQTFDTKFMAG